MILLIYNKTHSCIFFLDISHYLQQLAMVYFICYPLLILLSVPISGSVSASTGMRDIVSCLNHHSINNYTTSSNVHNHDYYNDLLKFSIQNLRFAEPTIPKPIAIILPESRDQLIGSVLCCTARGWEIRVRCGGHSYEGILYVSTDGEPFVIIDMMNLNRVSVDTETETAWVEGGATIGEKYHAIAESSSVHGFSAGSCPTIGAGGHIGGGGFGLLSRKYGLAADNVVDALLINADGVLLDRQSMGEDVFWAIRGGGGGGIWGIVYAWKIKLLKVPKIVTSFIVSSRHGTKAHIANLVNKCDMSQNINEGSMVILLLL